MKVLVQVTTSTKSGNVRAQVLKYDVEYDQRLGVVRWQLLPGQGELIHSTGASARGSVLGAHHPRKG